jgi:putative aldouronate transport system substrate-binding protein
MQYLDWMLEKGWFTLLNGFENEHYKLVDGTPQTIDGDKFEQEVAYAGEYAIVRNNAPAYKPDAVVAGAAPDPVSRRWAKLLSASLDVALTNKFRRDIPYSPNMAEINDALGSVGPKLFELRTRAIITGDITPGQALDQMRKEWRSSGGERADKLAQEWYERNKHSFE